ncbi:hypothetical protein H9W91_17450 [Streptomyces alfalfae]|uniref:hypothetical protein n=1 Tax=Streptomyces alfalfae TaxID=1642299 RepID=UPI001BA7847D|nr:hypothetical protein [Streptomyces alfalfae]QUI32447.1 hypothetical protein H9W91_17450 [Streptomyces alfalfae]
MIHQPHLIAELRDRPPEDGWSCHETTGRACTVCPCGLSTGFIETSAAIDAYRDHCPTGQKIHVHITAGVKDVEAITRNVAGRLQGR